MQSPLIPLPLSPSSPVSPRRSKPTHVKRESADSFGDFVSFPDHQSKDNGNNLSRMEEEDPLGFLDPLSSRSVKNSCSDSKELNFGNDLLGSFSSTGFFNEAKERSRANEKRVLDELLEHEDDPLYWFERHTNADAGGSGGDDLGIETVEREKERDEEFEFSNGDAAKPGEMKDMVATNSSTATTTTKGSYAKPKDIPASPTSKLSRSNSTPSIHSPFPHPPHPTTSTTTSSTPPKPISSPPQQHSALSTLSRSFLSTLSRSPRSHPNPSLPSPQQPTRSLTSTPTPSHPHSDHAPLHHSTLGFFPSPPPSSSQIYSHRPSSSHLVPQISYTHSYIPPSGAPGFTNVPTSLNIRNFDIKPSDLSDVSLYKRLKLVGRKESTEGVLGVGLADAIRPHLPALPRLTSQWTLLFSLDQHGYSLHTFYSRAASPLSSTSKSFTTPSQTSVGSLLVLKDSDGVIFGAWLGERIRECDGAYYGSGDSFLWKLSSPSPSPGSKDKDVKIKTFKWTGKNDYVALCESDAISFGGGEGHYGLYLSSSLIEGSSAWCPTFDNEVLCGLPEELGELVSFDKGANGDGNGFGHYGELGGDGGEGKRHKEKVKDVKFDCVGVELWGIGMGG